MTQTETKKCQNCNQGFTIEPEDFEFYEKMKVPPPTFCPECRLQRRLTFRNERTLYKGKCNAPGHNEDLISLFNKDYSGKVYDQKFWWSDEWDSMEYGRDYDWNKPFFEQLSELIRVVPLPALITDYGTMIRSEYSNWAGQLKDCFLITDADFVENSAYGSSVFKCKDCFDCDNISESELCYSSFNLAKCYRVFYSVNCRGCTHVFFSKNCSGCSNCFGCVNLKNKSYHVFNKPYSKEEYQNKINELFGGLYNNLQDLREKMEILNLKYPQKYFQGFSNVKTTGDYIHHSKNTQHGFLSSDVEDSKYVTLLHSKSTKDCYDYTDWGENAQRLYECMTVGLGAYNIAFSHLTIRRVDNIRYGYFCVTSSDLFGCVGLRNKQHCILNKQYTKEEYEELVPKIIQHMNDMPYVDKKGRIYKYGEFFPIELSPFAYNETIAQEYFPLTKKEAQEKGYTWKDPEKRDYKIDIKTEELKDNIKDVGDDIIDKIIECQHQGKCNEQCTEAFKIIKPELEFYKKMNLPLPRLCPNCRHYQRIKQRNPLKLWHRKCQCAGEQSDNGVYKNTIEHPHHGKEHCPNEFETTYSPDRPEIVYCEKCYQAEIM